MKICILTAGKGTRMGVSSKQINKALLPIDHKAVISHIIEKFSIDDVFVIALGYKGDQVINYLKSAHPKNKFEFVQVENFDREGSGPGLSLISCMENLQEPFLFFACDGLFFDEINNFDHNWIGISKINSNESSSYCNISIDNGKVLEIRDKQKCDDSFYAFTGSMFVKDFDIFWDSLKENKMVNGEHQLSNGFKGLMDKHSLYGYQNDWRDVGDWEKYQTVQKQFDSASMLKTNEFIYFINNRVLKFYADSSITDNRVKKSKINDEILPRFEKAGDNFYLYPFWDGETLYSCITPQLCKKLLEWLDEKVWNRQDIKSELMKDACHDFYHKKTLKRISLFNQNNPKYNEPKFVNKEEIPSVSELLKKIPWKEIDDGIPCLIHGDLQFQNILYNPQKEKFLLIDWRQDFAGHTNFGDLYYDLAKLYGGIKMNYDYIMKDLYHFEQNNQDAHVNFNNWENDSEYEKQLEDFIERKGFELKKVKLLTGLIYLNMAALHHEPFNFALMANGRKIIFDALKTYGVYE